jgi:hypothetical protein
MKYINYSIISASVLVYLGPQVPIQLSDLCIYSKLLDYSCPYPLHCVYLHYLNYSGPYSA